jgi:outer membrane protein assembly factor BamB/DNA-binding protein H-NS
VTNNKPEESPAHVDHDSLVGMTTKEKFDTASRFFEAIVTAIFSWPMALLIVLLLIHDQLPDMARSITGIGPGGITMEARVDNLGVALQKLDDAQQQLATAQAQLVTAQAQVAATQQTIQQQVQGLNCRVSQLGTPQPQKVQDEAQRAPNSNTVSMFRSNPARTGEQLGPGPIGAGTLLRSYWLGGDVTSSPVVADGTIFVGSWDGSLYAWTAVGKGQDPLWIFRTGGPVESSPAVANGIVYVGSDDGCLYALDARSGQERWRYDTGGQIISSPAVAGDTVFVGNGGVSASSSALYALDAKTGQPRWPTPYKVDGPILSSPAVVGDSIYFGTWNRGEPNVFALNTQTGSEQWSAEVGGEVLASPAVADGTVYIGSYDGYLYLLSTHSGDQLAKLEAWDGSPVSDEQKLIYASPAVVNGTVYVSSWAGDLFAWDVKMRTRLWALDITDMTDTRAASPNDSNKGPRSSPAVVGDTVYVGSNNGFLYAVDAKSGDVRWRYPTTGPVRSSPAVVDGVVYVGVADDDGSVFALGSSGAPATGIDTGPAQPVRPASPVPVLSTPASSSSPQPVPS